MNKVSIAFSILALAGCSKQEAIELIIDPSNPVIEVGFDRPAYYMLAQTDPDNVAVNDGGRTKQILSMFGREDLIERTGAAVSAQTSCAALDASLDPLDEIERRAKETSIVIVNEAHDQSYHRAFISDVAKRLHAIGYEIYAAETFSNTPEGDGANINAHPQEPFARDNQGYYISEPAFGRLLRDVKSLGYELVAYEAIIDPSTQTGADLLTRIHSREEGQTANLVKKIFRDRPNAKVLIHVGYSHAQEEPVRFSADSTEEATWMAARLKKATGIDPLTVSQTTCWEGGDTTRLAANPDWLPSAPFDLIVDHPRVEFEYGRPAWRRERGDIPTDIPDVFAPPETGWAVIEARLESEPDDAIPMDRVAIRAADDNPVKLMLPPGRYKVRRVTFKTAAPAASDAP